MDKVLVKYLDAGLKEKDKNLQFIGGYGHSNWVDVRVCGVKINGGKVEPFDTFSEETEDGFRDIQGVEYHAGDVLMVKLGFACKMPEGMEAWLVARSGTFKKHGLIQTNCFGVIDSSYRGNSDEWCIPFYAVRDGVLEQYERVGQFRISPVMEYTEFEEVDDLGSGNRGGFGSTGRN